MCIFVAAMFVNIYVPGIVSIVNCVNVYRMTAGMCMCFIVDTITLHVQV